MAKPKIKAKAKSKPTPILTATPVERSPYSVDTAGLEQRTSAIRGPGLSAATAEPVVYFQPEAYEKMVQIVEECQLEVGWFCSVSKLSKTDYLIEDVYLPHQEVTAVETDIPAEALEEAYLAMLEQGKDPSTLYAWFHSHVNMGVSPSGQDELQVESFLQTCPVFIRGIMNKAGALKVDLYLRTEGIAYNSVHTERYYPPMSQEAVAALSIEITAKVKKQPSPVWNKPAQLNYGTTSALTKGLATSNYPLDHNAAHEGYTPRSTVGSGYYRNQSYYPGEFYE
tara:strand:- start:345 stop:1190 length:846 start_codon:yes stop_codon:yes gene_type:complete